VDRDRPCESLHISITSVRLFRVTECDAFEVLDWEEGVLDVALLKA